MAEDYSANFTFTCTFLYRQYSINIQNRFCFFVCQIVLYKIRDSRPSYIMKNAFHFDTEYSTIKELLLILR